MPWAEALSAISLGIIAIVLVVCGIAWLRWLHELHDFMRSVERLVSLLDHDARPALQSMRSVAEDVGHVVRTVRSEVDGYAEHAGELRGRVLKLVNQVEDRLRDLESVIDIVQSEVEEAALDFAAALRTTRRSASILRAVKRAFLRARSR